MARLPDRLQRLDLGGNALSGPIPSDLAELINLQHLWLGDNALSGSIPSKLGQLTDLRALDLGTNELSGPIPASLGDLDYLQELKLHENLLTGPIPRELTQLSLGRFWIHSTDLCVPAEAAFQTWLDAIEDFRGTICGQSPTAGADLVVDSPAVSDNTLTPGQTFAFSATVRNQGSDASAVTALRYYRSTDAAISTSDTIDGVPTAVGSLPAGGTQPAQVGLTAPATAGTYYYGACVDAVTGESDTNNCSAGVTVTVADEETPTPGIRDPDKDFNTLSAAGNNEPYGLWSDGTTMWVADWLDGKIYAYSMATRERDPGRDFDTLLAAGNDSPRGLWSDGTTMWVADFADRKVYAYSMATRGHDPDKDFDAVRAAGSAGLWSDGVTMWVADFLEIEAPCARDGDRRP